MTMEQQDSILLRVARAIYDAQPRNRPWEKLPHAQQEYCVTLARAAIEAMKAPTLPMVRAGFLAITDYEDDYDLKVVVDLRANACWMKMLDAALSEPMP